MSNEKTKENRQAGNASQKGKEVSHLKQGRKTKRVKGQDAKMGSRGGYDHARPINNRKSKKHVTSRKVTASRAAGNGKPRVEKTPPGKLPRGKNGDGKRWVPWVEIPNSAQVHHYYYVIREMLEGAVPADVKDRAHRLGVQQLDLHGPTVGSVESLLTNSPRLRRDWRSVVGILRMLHEDNYIPASFVEKVLKNHPLTGAKSVQVVEDTSVVEDFVQDRVRASNKKWVSEAKASYARAITKLRENFNESFMEEQQQLFPGLTEEQYMQAADKAWAGWPENRKMPVIDHDGQTFVCKNEQAFVTAHMTRRAYKAARRLPTLFRMSGGISYEVLEDNEFKRKSDFVNIEYATKPDGGVWFAVVNGGNKKKSANSPFRSQYCQMSSHKDVRLYIDDIDTPKSATTDHIQRAPRDVAPEITDDMSVPEMLRVMEDRGWSAGRVKARPERKRQPKRTRKTQPSRGKPRVGRKSREG